MEQRIRIRTVILLWLLLSGISGVQAQSAGDIDTLSQWRVSHRQDWPPYGSVYDHYKYYISGTITIDSQEYYKVYKSGYSYADPANLYIYEHVYVGALREEGNKWYYGNDLLYDFTMEIGDTVYPFNQGLIITVIDIDTIMIDGSPKKRFQLDYAGWNYGEEYIIEAVGATTGLFEELFFFEWESDLYCYAIDYLPLWLNPEFNQCDLTVQIIEYEGLNNAFAYPNPFTTSTTIEYELTEPSHIQLTIYNTIGETIQMAEDRLMPVGKHSFTWSPEKLPKGMYYAVLKSEEGVSVVKMIKQ